MNLQFFYIDDLCRFIDILLEKRPDRRIFNVGNSEPVSVKEWVELCYKTVGKTADFVNVRADLEQRFYFSFYDYEYHLDVRRQNELMSETTPLETGLKAAFEWYLANQDKVGKKPMIEFIDKNLR